MAAICSTCGHSMEPISQDFVCLWCAWAELKAIKQAGLPATPVSSHQRAPVPSGGVSCTCAGIIIQTNPLCPIHGDQRDTSIGAQ